MNWKIKDIGGALRLLLHFGIPLGALLLFAIGQAVAGESNGENILLYVKAFPVGE